MEKGEGRFFISQLELYIIIYDTYNMLLKLARRFFSIHC